MKTQLWSYRHHKFKVTTWSFFWHYFPLPSFHYETDWPFNSFQSLFIWLQGFNSTINSHKASSNLWYSETWLWYIMVIVQTTYHNYFERSNIDKHLWYTSIKHGLNMDKTSFLHLSQSALPRLRTTFEMFPPPLQEMVVQAVKASLPMKTEPGTVERLDWQLRAGKPSLMGI